MSFQRSLLPEGKYHGRIIKQDVYSTKGDEGGTPYFGFTVLLEQKENDIGNRVELVPPMTRMLKLWVNSPGNIERTVKSLRFLGFKDESEEAVNRLNPFAEDHYSLVDVKVTLDISHQPDNKGNPTESIWLDTSSRPLANEKKAAITNSIASLFAAYQQQAAEKAGTSKPADDAVTLTKRPLPDYEPVDNQEETPF